MQQQTGLSFEQLVEKLKEHLHVEPYTLEEVAKELGLTVIASLMIKVTVVKVEEVTNQYLGNVRNSSFECYKRALHVWTESGRVYNFR